MNELIMYGSSDDLIVVESTTFKNEEFNVYPVDAASFILAVSDGSLFRVFYDEDGIWRFTPLLVGSSSVDIKYGQDDRNHSDRVTMVGENLQWVVLGSYIAK